ncbi:MAG: hypothetical protein F6K58_26935 [Symploca sp. SIO2E9]|nr:hypothetical protein [Symploca sp. SIO2E9]
MPRLKTRGHGDTGTRGQIGWGFDPNQFYAPQVTVGYLTQINFDKIIDRGGSIRSIFNDIATDMSVRTSYFDSKGTGNREKESVLTAVATAILMILSLPVTTCAN